MHKVGLYTLGCKVSLYETEAVAESFAERGFEVCDLRNEKGESIESAPHPSMKFMMKVPFEVKEGDILRSSER